MLPITLYYLPILFFIYLNVDYASLFYTLLYLDGFSFFYYCLYRLLVNYDIFLSEISYLWLDIPVLSKLEEDLVLE